MISFTLAVLGSVAMIFSQPRLTERALADVAVIRVPRNVKERYKSGREDQAGRMTFTFSDDYFWASFGSSTAYKQQLFVSLMASDASDAEYEAYPRRMSLSYDPRTVHPTKPLGSGMLKVIEGVYIQNTLAEPAHTFIYIDRTRRLQIAWHAVEKEVDLATGTNAIGRMAASFRIKREPNEVFAEVRDRPRKEAEDHARRVALARETLVREGYGPLEPGKPVLEDGVYAEWMIDPEPRYQLLIPLGRVRTAADASRGSRPRPAALTNPDGTRRGLAGTVGWLEFVEGAWEFSNHENDYLPFDGLRALLASQHTDPNYTYFYYSGSVRVHHVPNDDALTSVRWFLNSVPEVRRLWKEGKLVRGGAPEND